MKNVFCMTTKGRQDLTEVCMRGLRKTAGEHVMLVIIDAGDGADKISPDLLIDCTREYKDGTTMGCMYYHKPNCGITEGWNYGIDYIAETFGTENVAVWLINNDIIFHKSGWLQLMHNKLTEYSVGMVGTYAMAASGYRFVTGGVWGFRLKEALSIAENGKVLDEQFNFSYQDVDISVRMNKAGYETAGFFGVEFGDDPYMTHLISQTTRSPDAEARHAEICKLEEDRFDKKHGRKP